MCAGDDDWASTGQHSVMEEFGQRNVGDLGLIEQPLHLWITPAHSVADDDLIRPECGETVSVEALKHLNTGIGQHIRHGRIDARVATQHFMALFFD